MATKAEVDAVFSALRDDLQSKIDSGDYNTWFAELRRLHLAVATALRAFQQRPAHGDSSEAYNAPVAAGREALGASQSLQPGDEAGLRRLQQLVIHAVGELQFVTAALTMSSAHRVFVGGLRGALRVSPDTDAAAFGGAQPPDALGPILRPQVLGAQGRILTPQAVATPAKQTQPPYIASVALLFPIEAATLFPLGRSIAGSSPYALTTVIALIVGFIIALRYFATQQEGGSSPVVKEIIIAVASFLLWVGALGGYWVPGPLGLDFGISADLGAKLYGFTIIMWVAIVPHFVRKPASPQDP